LLIGSSDGAGAPGAPGAPVAAGAAPVAGRPHLERRRERRVAASTSTSGRSLRRRASAGAERPLSHSQSLLERGQCDQLVDGGVGQRGAREHELSQACVRAQLREGRVVGARRAQVEAPQLGHARDERERRRAGAGTREREIGDLRAQRLEQLGDPRVVELRRRGGEIDHQQVRAALARLDVHERALELGERGGVCGRRTGGERRGRSGLRGRRLRALRRPVERRAGAIHSAIARISSAGRLGLAVGGMWSSSSSGSLRRLTSSLCRRPGDQDRPALAALLDRSGIGQREPALALGFAVAGSAARREDRRDRRVGDAARSRRGRRRRRRIGSARHGGRGRALLQGSNRKFAPCVSVAPIVTGRQDERHGEHEARRDRP
jgi:hypothetical protein